MKKEVRGYLRQTALAALVLTVALCHLPVVAQQTVVVDGNSLHNVCVYATQIELKQQASEEELGKAAFCVGYIRATLDWITLDGTSKVTRSVRNVDLPQPCVPESVSSDQAMKVVVKYLHDNRAMLNLPANFLIRKAMATAFPCPVK